MPKRNNSKTLLRAAEKMILTLQAEGRALQADLDHVIEAQAHETEQLVKMTEQLWKLEDTLLSTTAEKDVALMILRNLKSDVQRLKSFTKDTLDSLKKNNASRLNLTVRVYEIKSMVEALKIEKKL